MLVPSKVSILIKYVFPLETAVFLTSPTKAPASTLSPKTIPEISDTVGLCWFPSYSMLVVFHLKVKVFGVIVQTLTAFSAEIV